MSTEMEDMPTMNIQSYVQSCVDDYKKFVGINSFPSFTIKSKEITLEKVLKQGFDTPAAVYYDITTGTHLLEIWSILYLPQMNAKYLIFHEFTHIWDAEVYSLKDKLGHMSNKGYTEYHAAQIDFMKILGAHNIYEPFSFDANQSIETFGGTKSAKEFVRMPLKLATELISRSDFSDNIETLVTTMGTIFNYYGRRSICKMYATNYDDNADVNVIKSFLGVEAVNALDVYMLGWFNKNKVALIDELYKRMVLTFASKYKLS